MPCHLVTTAAASQRVEVASSADRIHPSNATWRWPVYQMAIAKEVTKALPAWVETWGKAGWYLMGFSFHGVTPAQDTAVLHPLQSSSTAVLGLQMAFCLFACSCGPLQLQGGGCSDPHQRWLSRGA